MAIISKTIDREVKNKMEYLIRLGIVYKITMNSYKFIQGKFKKVGLQSHIALKFGKRFYYPDRIYTKFTTQPLNFKKYKFDDRDMAELLDVVCLLDEIKEGVNLK